ncbi:GNAT family N-acetyltransferase [Celerinatantimonas sp. MCCC 1A17872]|uniref:GNAT family N-acetyltransferase n=1 Tax=Celerinatantimonas sp. MCCC 1A17872 TaxID=3177514 RepID=UPI0038BEFD00
MQIKSISAEQTLAIRHQVLWPKQSVEFCRLEDDSQGMHYGAFENEKLVCVASIFISNNSARLRKFAILEPYRKQGIGTAMLKHIIEQLRAQQVSDFWCDARQSAQTFYAKFGLTVQSELFYKKDVPYFQMSLALR